MPKNNRFLKIGGALLLILILTAGGVAYYLYSRVYVSTDNAYVSGHQGVVSPRVAGRVLKVRVDDNQFVQPGQVLAELDPEDFQVAVNQAEAALKALRNEVAQGYAAVSEAQAKVAKSAAQFKQATIDRERYAKLYERRTVSKETLDRMVTNYSVTQAELNQAQEAHRQALAAVSGSTRIPLEEQPAIKEAAAHLDQALLNLEYTRIIAPFAGYITKKQVEPGNWVRPGQPLLVLISLDYSQIWVEANFKETQLTNVRLGQPATIKVDTYPGVAFHGKVESIMAGTGATFTLLPPENATGNWVKVVQRIPVKVALVPPFPQEHPLRLGMSTQVTIDTKDRSGPRLRKENSGGGG